MSVSQSFSIPFSPVRGHGGLLVPIPAIIGREAGGTPWTGRQSIAGPTSTLTFTPTGNLESPINLMSMSLDGGRKPEYPERTHADTGRTCKLHTERIRTGDLLAVRHQC